MRQKTGNLLLLISIVILVAVVVLDRIYVSNFKQRFLSLEKKRIETSNKLATAKIVHENLNHVRDMVFENMDFPNQPDSLTQETHIFNFITSCINDLKLKLVSVKPLRPQGSGLITTYGYEIEILGDFFNFGELCSKFENSRRIISLETYEVCPLSKQELLLEGGSNRTIHVKMRINTFRVKKS